MRYTPLAAVSLALLILTACSDPLRQEPETSPAPVNPLDSPVLEEPDEEGARGAVETYIGAVRAGDGQVGCFTLSEEARQSLAAEGEGTDCAEAFAEALAAPDTTASTGEVELAQDGQSATVHLDYSGPAQDRTPSVTVLWSDGVWLLDSAYPL